jgi:uncharacterized membrane protein YeaQ/YmgE (transglycosylase-associated protein family)
MSVIVFVLVLLLSGLLVGALGRLALPGPDPMTIGMTILVGIGGSFIGGLVGWLLFGRNGGGIVYLIRRSRGGSLTDPGRYP